jgi:predicted ester cyclase
MMSAPDPREPARTLLEKVVGGGQPDLADLVVARDVRLLRPGFKSTARALVGAQHRMAPTPQEAIEGIKRGAIAMREPFPDYSQKVRRQIVEGDTVVNLVSVGGTHEGEFFGVPATGKTVQMDAIIITRVADGRVTEVFALGDELGLLLDLGFSLHAPGSA